MTISEQRIRTIEQNVHELETKANLGAHNLDQLTQRVEQISESLTRLEETIGNFLQFWQGFLQFLRHTTIWALGILSTVIGAVIAWYITMHLMH